ncbi:YgdI/YgdR family lipoprotein [Klebsiella pneumoniae]|nr:YgdI/YgdR family lipoprotein [Klebsiella pneumoniae]
MAFEKDFCFSVRSGSSLSALTGCTRTSYAIHTNDGRTIVSDKPKESDSGLLGYTDANGVKQQINKTDVKEVSEIPH